MFDLVILAGTAVEEANKFGVVQALAIIGGAYTVIRTIVWFTPTKRDDKAVEKVDRWLVIFKTVTGLSLNQGIKKHGPK